MLEPMLNEFREEAAVTKRVLERVPPDKLSWKPHPKSNVARAIGAFTWQNIPGSWQSWHSSKSLTPRKRISSRRLLTI